MYPVQTHSAHRAARSGGSGFPLNGGPAVPDGEDLPEQRLTNDNSRAVPTYYLALDTNATLPVSPDLAHLLALDGRTVDLNQPAPLFSLKSVGTEVAPVVIHHDIPASSWRFLDMPVVELLVEVLQRSIGEGPEDPVPRTDIHPEHHRLHTMSFALSLTPGREHDALVLRNAGMALNSFYFDYRTLLEEIRAKRPDLLPVLGPWKAEIARSAILQAVALPLGDDGEPQFAPALYNGIIDLIRQPFENYIPGLEWRLGELEQKTFADQSRRYFSFVATPIVRAAPRENRVLGAAANEFEGTDARTFLAGTLIFRCTREELIGHLQMIPAGRLKRSSTMHSSWVVGISLRPAHDVVYPDRSSGTTIKEVQWQNPAGVTTPINVANWMGVHSYSEDLGRTWQPTGAPTSNVLDNLRADGWRSLMADRWHTHRRGFLSAGWSGGVGN